MFKCKNKFWLEDPTELFCDTKFIPLQGMNLESQFNSVSRLAIVLFCASLLIQSIFFPKSSIKLNIGFLISSLIIIIILYNNQKNSMTTTEKYTLIEDPTYMIQRQPNIIPPPNYRRADIQPDPNTNNMELVINRPTNFRFYDDEVAFDFNDPKYVSANQKLAGKANPRTLIPPVIVPPSSDLSYWRANNTVTHSAVNDQTQIDTYLSGYQVSNCCGIVGNDTYIVPERKKSNNVRYMPKSKYTVLKYQNSNPNDDPYLDETSKKEVTKNVINEKFKLPFEIRPEEPGQVNTSCGYNPQQVKYGLPSNLNIGKCFDNPSMTEYNKNLFTQTIQPGVYEINQVNEPINSNIGISFTQQFEPLTSSVTADGDVLYTEHDPRIIEPLKSDNELGDYCENSPADPSNVYDPRFSGYGTSYRAYTDETTGQTRFYYDDVNAIRMPNYLTRNNIDFTPFSDSYGPMATQNGNKYNSIITGLAEDAFTRNTIQQRTELQERLMRKMNANKWQQRMYPIGNRYM